MSCYTFQFVSVTLSFVQDPKQTFVVSRNKLKQLGVLVCFGSIRTEERSSSVEFGELPTNMKTFVLYDIFKVRTISLLFSIPFGISK